MAANYIDIPATLNLPTQAPLNKAEFTTNEVTLGNLGVGNILAYTYFERMVITTFEEGTSWEWRETELVEPVPGLIPGGFTYPANITAYGITYSNRNFNFFKILQNGTNGTDGTDGTKWYSASAIPANSVGVDGDFAINENRPNQVWLKTAGVWAIYISSLDGADGTDGTNGAPGANASMNLQRSLGVVASYTLQDTDNNYVLLVNGGTTIVIDSAVAPALRSAFNCGFIQMTAGVVQFQGVGAAVINSGINVVTNKIRGLYYNAYIERVAATNQYILLGNIVTI